MRRFLCLWFPRWPTDRWRRQAEPQPGPFVLTASGQGGIRLTAVDRAASRLGLVVGMPLADARALVPGLTVADAASQDDAKALAALADWCTRYGPWCAVDGDDGIRLDITGCDHLFGGEVDMLAGMEQRLQAFGFAVRGAVADTPAAAWGWARYRPKIRPPVLETGQSDPLLSLPVTALRLDADSLETLAVLGLATVGAVAALPRGPLAQRLGVAVLERLDRMFGRVAEPISPRPVAEPWISRMIFPEAIGRREDIDAAAERLVEYLCTEMSLKGQGARRLTLRFYRVDGGVQHLTVGTSGPSHAPVHILRLFAERLEMVAPGFGIEAMVLEATETEPLSPLQSAFTSAGEADPATLVALIDRLQNRLGPNRVVQLVPVESHVPERAEIQKSAHAPSPSRRDRRSLIAFRNQPPLAAAGPSLSRKRERGLCGCSKSPSPVQTGEGGTRRISDGRVRGLFVSTPFKSPRPLTLLPIPEPIEAIAPVPDDPPLSFRWRRNLHRVAFADGPERIGPEWWLPGQGRARDYYRVEDAAGRRFWLYREGLYGAAEPPCWFLHGFFP